MTLCSGQTLSTNYVCMVGENCTGTLCVFVCRGGGDYIAAYVLWACSGDARKGSGVVSGLCDSGVFLKCTGDLDLRGEHSC